ncbi:ABC transporter substrate-binding protein [Dactylosporangium sp. CA-139066]|uniref:ABC transporter substrate-binding protein n=1 Tax=Dactylosporangium sp. CA-139066 TaxID=3239930 RepID=UPI003D8B0541
MDDPTSRPLSRRSIFRLAGGGIAALAGGGLLSACTSATSPKTSPTTAGPAGGPITVADIADDTDKPSVAAAAAAVTAFKAKQPNITVTTKLQPSGADEVAAFIASRSAPTAYVISSNDVSPMIAAKQVPDITAIIKKWEHYDELAPALLDTFGLNGVYYGLPQYSGSTGLVISKPLFQSAGLDPADWQKGGKTFADFRAAAKAISDKNPGVAGFQATLKGPRQGGLSLLTLMYANGQLTYSQDTATKKYTATCNTPQAVAALQLLQQMRWQDKSLGSNPIVAYLDGFKALASGKAAMCMSAFDGPGQVAAAGAEHSDDFIMVPFPINDAANGSLIGSGSGYVFSNSAGPSELQAAFDYTVFENLSVEGVSAYYKAWSEAGKADGSGETPQAVPFATLLLKSGSALRAQIEAAVKPYVPAYSLSLYGDYFATTAKMKLAPEPVFKGKEIKTALQTPVEVIMTNANANAQTEMDKANTVIQQALNA